MVIGLAVKVPECVTGGLPGRGSNTAMCSGLPAKAPTGKPPPMILPSVTMSASTSIAPTRPDSPSRKLTTSSTISNAPIFVVSARSAARNAGLASIIPSREGIRSTSTAAMRPALAASVRASASGSLNGTTSVSAAIAAGAPLT